uniref:Uncharacterized protein n=1 Tax=Cacopsylla melanoneura TaxID=428564 RepID=A0A8D8SRT6_9HEMI
MLWRIGMLGSEMASLAKKSAFSFPSIPTCDGTHRNSILVSGLEWMRHLMAETNGLIDILFSIDCKALDESEQIKKFLEGKKGNLLAINSRQYRMANSSALAIQQRGLIFILNIK